MAPSERAEGSALVAEPMAPGAQLVSAEAEKWGCLRLVNLRVLRRRARNVRDLVSNIHVLHR